MTIRQTNQRFYTGGEAVEAAVAGAIVTVEAAIAAAGADVALEAAAAAEAAVAVVAEPGAGVVVAAVVAGPGAGVVVAAVVAGPGAEVAVVAAVAAVGGPGAGVAVEAAVTESHSINSCAAKMVTGNVNCASSLVEMLARCQHAWWRQGIIVINVIEYQMHSMLRFRAVPNLNINN